MKKYRVTPKKLPFWKFIRLDPYDILGPVWISSWYEVVQTALNVPQQCKVVQLVLKISYGFVLKKFQTGNFLGHPVGFSLKEAFLRPPAEHPPGVEQRQRGGPGHA